jgi:4-hydroxythreonine-4-phosphate dehydrogenase
MMFVAEHIKTTLVTTHVQLKKVSSKLKTGDILNKIELTYDFLKKSFNIKNPLIGVCGLNPHASEQGLFGGEEQKIISPAVKQAKKKKIRTIGPESAESLFYKMYNKQIDAVISMYHDQALIAVKMVLRDKAVNLTLGLPFIRTSASSGTAYDIAGRLEASSLSMEEAIKLADNLIKPKKG